MTKTEVVNRIAIEIAAPEDEIEGAGEINAATAALLDLIKADLQGHINRINSVYAAGLRFVGADWDWYEDRTDELEE